MRRFNATRPMEEADLGDYVRYDGVFVTLQHREKELEKCLRHKKHLLGVLRQIEGAYVADPNDPDLAPRMVALARMALDEYTHHG